MKKLFLALAITASFVACKSKTENSLDTNKDLILLSDSSNLNNSYLTDTGYVNNGVIPGNNVSAAPSRATSSPAPARRRTTTSSGSNNNNTVSNAPTSGTSQQSAPQRRGISKAAKGAIIGGVGGAAAGAIIGKNAKGAVIGGAVGAAGGYIIGRGKDRRDGRVQ